MEGADTTPTAITDDTPLRLSVAAEMAYPGGGMTASGLRKEAARGRLVIERTAGKDYTTLAAIADMRRLCRVVRSPKGPDPKPPAAGHVAIDARTAEGKLEILRRMAATAKIADADLKAKKMTKRERDALEQCLTAQPDFSNLGNHWHRSVRWLALHGFIETYQNGRYEDLGRITPAGEAEWRRISRVKPSEGSAR